MAVSPVYPHARASAAAAVFGCYSPRVAVAAAAVDGYPLLRVAFQCPDSSHQVGPVAEQSPWKRINFRRAVVISRSLRLCVTSGFSSSTLFKASPLEESDGDRDEFSVKLRWVSHPALSRPCLCNGLASIAPSMAQRTGGGSRTAVCVGDLCGAGRAGPFVLGKSSIFIAEWNVGEKIFLPYFFTSMEKDLKEKSVAAAAIIIECLFVSGPLIIGT